MALQARTTNKGDAWWRSLSKQEKMDEVHPLIYTHGMTNGQIQRHLELSGIGSVIHARYNIKHQKAGTKPPRSSQGDDIGKQGTRSAPITLAGGTDDRKQLHASSLSSCNRALRPGAYGSKDSIFPEPSDELPATYIRAIESLYS